MNVQKNIERQEREFKELLQKVMREPLSPLSHSVQALDQRLDQLEQMLRDMRDIDLSALSLEAEQVNKQLRTLKSLTEDAPLTVRQAMQPVLTQLQSQLQTDLQARLETAGQDTRTQLTVLSDAMGSSQIALQGTLQQGVAQLDGVSQSAWAHVQTGVSQLTSELNVKLTQQAASGQQSFVRLQELISLRTSELNAQGAAGLKSVAQQQTSESAALAAAMAQLNAVLSEQKQQLLLLQQQQDAFTQQLAEQVQHAMQPLRTWLVATVIASVAACSGVLVLLVMR